MRKFSYCLTLLVALMSISTYAMGQDQKAEDAKKAEKPTTVKIVIPGEGVLEFTVTGRSTLFRLTISTPSGGTIDEPVITGKAQLVRTAEITDVVEGGKPVIGAFRKEFEFRGTAEGKVKIDIKKTGPASSNPETITFNITIK